MFKGFANLIFVIWSALDVLESFEFFRNRYFENIYKRQRPHIDMTVYEWNGTNWTKIFAIQKA